MAMRKRDRRIVIGVVVFAFLAVLGIGIGIGLSAKSRATQVTVKTTPTSGGGGDTNEPPTSQPTHPTQGPGPTPGAGSGYGPYKHGAVATDAGVCSEIGRDTLRAGGSAVDAAISSSFCIGVINMHSAGIGGGGFMVIYNKTNQYAEVVDYREQAPASATQDMFAPRNISSRVGGLATGVPGEVKGLYEAHRKYGNLSWSELVQPAINLATNGFPISIPVHEAMGGKNEEYLRNDAGLRQLLFNGDKIKQLREVITNPQLAATLEKIRDEPTSFYNGCLAKDIVRDVKKAGGIITLEDLKNYSVKWKNALKNNLGDLTYFTSPPPSSGAVITMILNILKGYNMTTADRANDERSAVTYHRVIEAFKYAYAWRAKLGDPDFYNNTAYDNIREVLANMTKQSLADKLRGRIEDNNTYHNLDYYGDYYAGTGHEGTSHMSVLAPNGDAVSLTTTINFRFGAKYRSPVTGIIYNNEMDDFSTPGKVNGFGVAPSPSNFIMPGKRPMSSISPIIFTNTTNGIVQLIAGASGGTKITTATALVVMNKLWFGRELNAAVIDPRLHNQMSNTTYEIQEPKYTMPAAILRGLVARKNIVLPSGSYAVVQAIARTAEDIYAQSDPRKHGWAAGL